MAKPAWLDSRLGQLVKAVVALGLAYLFFSLAVDSGHIWQYVLTIVLIIAGFTFIIRIFRHGKD